MLVEAIIKVLTAPRPRKLPERSKLTGAEKYATKLKRARETSIDIVSIQVRSIKRKTTAREIIAINTLS